MDPGRHERATSLFVRARSLPAAERARFLAEACGRDGELQAEVESLLASDPDPGFLVAGTPGGALRAQAEAALGCGPGEDAPTADVPERIGPYRIVRWLGSGGMAAVYLAELEEARPFGPAGSVVALKVLHRELSGRRRGIERLIREAELGMRIAHPALVRTLELGVAGEGRTRSHFVALEYVAGRTLRSLTAEVGLLPEPMLRQIGARVAAALHAVHQARAVHRDVKPSNILITADQQVKLADLGIAWVQDEALRLTRTGQFVGTPLYAAPEQLGGGELGSGSDLYALGVVLYEAATGELPCRARGMAELGEQPRTAAPRIGGHGREVTPFFEAVVSCLLEREPRRRFASAAELEGVLAAGEESPWWRERRRWPRAGSTRPVDPAAGGVPHSLPAERDRFVGRKAELEELASRLGQGARLVTVLGSGGVGKTRLVGRYAATSLAAWPGGVWFCDLSEARSGDGVAAAVASALEAPLGSGDAVVQLGHAIAGRGRCLVLLDNFEPVVAHAEATLGRWLERAGEAAFVVTSRERLRVRGEEVMTLAPLSPDDEGVELFEVRARAHDLSFAPSAECEAEVRAIVRLVDGLPLAIELAAARIRILSPAQIRRRMADRFQLLAAGAGGGGRQATLRGTIDGSWELLQPWQRSALAQASVFAGGFTLEAAEAVLDLGAFPSAPPVIDVVQALVDKSLLQARTAAAPAAAREDEEPRFGMYASIQEYAAEKLAADGAIEAAASGPAAQQAAFARHGEYFARFGSDEARLGRLGPGGLARRRALERELDNLVAGCRRALARGDGAVAVGCYLAVHGALLSKGPLAAALELGESVGAAAALAPAEKSRLLSAMGMAMCLAGRLDEARRQLEAALAADSAAAGGRMKAQTLRFLALANNQPGRRDEARAHLAAALTLHRQLGDRVGEAACLETLGLIRFDERHVEDARARFEAALALHRASGDRAATAVSIGNLGICSQLDRFAQSRPLFEEALGIAREIGDRRVEGHFLGSLAEIDAWQGRLVGALARCEAALAIHREFGNRQGEASTRALIALVVLQLDRHEEARAHGRAALAISREIGSETWEAVALHGQGLIDLEQGAMSRARSAIEQALEIARAIRDPALEGQVLGSLGDLLSRVGMLVEAQAALERSQVLLRQLGHPAWLGVTLCARGEHEQRRGNLPVARACLQQVEGIAAEIEALSTSEIARRAARLRRALEGAPHTAAPGQAG